MPLPLRSVTVPIPAHAATSLPRVVVHSPQMSEGRWTNVFGMQTARQSTPNPLFRTISDAGHRNK